MGRPMKDDTPLKRDNKPPQKDCRECGSAPGRPCTRVDMKGGLHERKYPHFGRNLTANLPLETVIGRQRPVGPVNAR